MITRVRPLSAFLVGSRYCPLLCINLPYRGFPLGINICDIHAANNGNDVRALLDQANTLTNRGRIAVLGDFNKTPALTEAIARQTGFQVIAPRTPTHQNGKTLDYMCEKNLAFRNNCHAETLPNKGSDHWPVKIFRQG